MSKAVIVLLGTYVLVCIGTHCDCAEDAGMKLRGVYNNWNHREKLLRESAAKKEGAECNGTLQQTLSWMYLRNLFESKKKSGVLRYAWPRAAFYFEHTKSITESPLEDVIICNDSFVCVDKKCRNCYDFVDKQGQYKGDNRKASIACTGAYAAPEFPDPDTAGNELAWILKPRVSSPGPLTVEEMDSWMNWDGKTNPDCAASPEFSMSVSYLLKLKGMNATKREKLMATYPEFYAEKLKWLKGADKKIVTCEEGYVCGFDGVCVECGVGYFEEELLNEACWPEPASHFRRPIYGSPREAYGKWVDAFTSIKERSVDIREEDRRCNASVEQTLSWAYLLHLFHFHKKAGVLKFAWPRVNFYDEKLREVLVEGVAENGVFCEWKLGTDDGFMCHEGKCHTCREMRPNYYTNVPVSYHERCQEKHEKAEDAGVSWRRERELKGLILPLKTPKGKLTLEEALSWNATLESTARKGRLEACDVDPKLTLSVKYLLRRLMEVEEVEGISWRWRTKEEVKEEMAANKTTYDEKLKWLKVTNKTRRFCGDEFVCGVDGVCVPCGVLTDEVAELKEACGLWNTTRFIGFHSNESESTTEGGSGGRLTGEITSVAFFYLLHILLNVCDWAEGLLS